MTMNKDIKKTSLYKYLEPFLENGDMEQIAEARKEYWRKYKATWRRNKRQQEKEFTLSLTPRELQVLRHEKIKHNRSYTQFIKEAALSYCKKQFLIPDTIALNKIKELLALNYNALQQMTEEELPDTKTHDQLIKRMADLEERVLAILHNPVEVLNESNK
jgi:hypothetical protein